MTISTSDQQVNREKYDRNFDKIFGGHRKGKGGSFVQDAVTGKLVEREAIGASSHARVNAPMVMQPMEAFVSPIDNTVIRTRDQLNVHNRRHGVTNVRDYKDGYIKKKETQRVNEGQKYLNKTRRTDINSAIDKHS